MSFELRLGDCLDPVSGLASLADKSVDHVLTDPPYSEHVENNSIRGHGHRPGGRKQDLGFSFLTLDQMSQLAVQFHRIAKRWVIVFCTAEMLHDWRTALESAGLDYVRAGIWAKENSTPQFTGDRPAANYETIVIAHQPGRKTWNGGGRGCIWSAPTAYRAGDPIVHTTQKPLMLMEALVRDFTDRDELVLDPFSGSGTTGAAALRHGRRFIGWERDAKYHDHAQKRLGGAREQLGLFA